MLPFGYHVELLPTDYALRMRKPFIGMLTLLSILALCKVIIMDFWGGINTALVVVMGLFVISGEYSVNASSALLFSVMAMISGIFDIISCVLYFQHSKYSLFESKAPTLVIFAQCTFILSPIALLIAAYIAYSIYSDCQNQATEMYDQEAQMVHDDIQQRMQARAQRRQFAQRQANYGAAAWEGQPAQQRPAAAPPQPFQGQGQRLGSRIAAKYLISI